MANTINGSGTLTVAGGSGGNSNPSLPWGGKSGQIRLEAFKSTFNGTLNGPITQGAPFGVFLPSALPSVSVVSINGVPVKVPATGSFQTPDVTIAASGAVTLTIQATGIPVGTQVTLQIFSDNGTQQNPTSTPLVDSGDGKTTTATVSATFPAGFSLSFVKATWTAAPSAAKTNSTTKK